MNGYKDFDILFDEYKTGKCTQRSFIAMVKSSKYSETYAKVIKERTSFLDDYDVDVLERLYYIINDLNAVVKCKYCDNKATWTGELNGGYRDICNSRECRTKQLIDVHAGKKIISSNRDSKFIEKQKQIQYVDDDVIKDLIKYDKQVYLIDNPIIIEYLKKRFNDNDSDDILESVQRILTNTIIRPKCKRENCNNYTKWWKRKDRMYATYCSNKCSNCSIDIKNKKEQKCNLKYGVKTFLLSSEYADIMREHVLNNSKYGTSDEENNIYTWLVELGYTVEHFHVDNIFNYKVDFYLPDYDLYIEYQGSQFHNGKSFVGSKDDYLELNTLLEKDKKKREESGKDKSQYGAIVYTWSELDVKKREIAKELGLKYLELYDCKSKESLEHQLNVFLMFLRMRDLFEYTEDELNKEYEHYRILNAGDALSNSVSSDNKIVKYFNGDNFYKKEIDLFVNDPVIRRKLIQNRTKYLNKKESELTIQDILLGFKISGLYYGNSHFNPQWTKWFVEKYEIRTIYDPCGGWGHHILGMLSCDKIVYNDFSKSTVEGVRRMKDFFHIDNLEIHYGDCTKYIPEDVDAWFMCPPYYNLEHYECGDFEDIEEYRIFLKNIFDLWIKSKSHMFGVIIRDDLIKYIPIDYSDRFKVNCNKSHFGKVAQEYMYIFNK